jgi:hypothetical protein
MATAASNITAQAVVVRNARVDRSLIATQASRANGGLHNKSLYDRVNVDTEVFSIAPGELAFRLSDPTSARATGGYSGTTASNDLKIFTCMNNFPIGSAGETPSAGEGKIKFVGIPSTMYNAAEANQKDSIAVVVSGSQTITHNSAVDDVIEIGDDVCWYLPEPDNCSTGHSLGGIIGNNVPRGKVVAHTCNLKQLIQKRPDGVGVTKGGLSAVVKDFTTTYKDKKVSDFIKDRTFDSTLLPGLSKMHQTLKGSIANDVEFQEMPAPEMAKYLQAATWLCEHFQQQTLTLRNHVVGVALSRAEPGEPLDILVRAAH